MVAYTKDVRIEDALKKLASNSVCVHVNLMSLIDIPPFSYMTAVMSIKIGNRPLALTNT